MLPLFTKTLVLARQVRTFEVAPLPHLGWEASEKSGADIITQRRFSDWHRVERTLTRFVREIDELRRQGWVEV